MAYFIVFVVGGFVGLFLAAMMGAAARGDQDQERYEAYQAGREYEQKLTARTVSVKDREIIL